jgi:predicted small lipoprotein YifL
MLTDDASDSEGTRVLRRTMPAALMVAVLLAACGSSGPAISDPREIVTKGVEATTQLDTAHVAVTIEGTASVPGSDSQLSLDGTTVEGDVDLAARQSHFSFTAMGFTGELISDGADTYIKTPLTGPKWMKSTGASGDPVSGLTDPAQILEGVRGFLDTEGVDVEKLSDADCGSGRCYAVRLTIPADQVSGAGNVAGVDLSQLVGDALVLDLLFDRDDLWLSDASTQLGSEALGQLTLRVALSAYDEDVSIELPPADEVTEGGGNPLFGF